MTSELDRLERRAQEVRGQLALDLDELFLRLQPRRMARNVAVYARDTQAGERLGPRHRPRHATQPDSLSAGRYRHRGTCLGNYELFAIAHRQPSARVQRSRFRTASRAPSRRDIPGRAGRSRSYGGVRDSACRDPSDFVGHSRNRRGRSVR